MEYLLSRQLDEAAACVKELDCSLFHHEIVKRAVKVRGGEGGRRKKMAQEAIGFLTSRMSVGRSVGRCYASVSWASFWPLVPAGTSLPSIYQRR